MTREQFEKLKVYTHEDAQSGKAACYMLKDGEYAQSISVTLLKKNVAIEWDGGFAHCYGLQELHQYGIRVYEEPPAPVGINVFVILNAKLNILCSKILCAMQRM